MGVNNEIYRFVRERVLREEEQRMDDEAFPPFEPIARFDLRVRGRGIEAGGQQDLQSVVEPVKDVVPQPEAVSAQDRVISITYKPWDGIGLASKIHPYATWPGETPQETNK